MHHIDLFFYPSLCLPIDIIEKFRFFLRHHRCLSERESKSRLDLTFDLYVYLNVVNFVVEIGNHLRKQFAQNIHGAIRLPELLQRRQGFSMTRQGNQLFRLWGEILEKWRDR